MTIPHQTFWKGEPNYVFEISALESESNNDPFLGSTNPFVLYIIFIGSVLIFASTYSLESKWIIPVIIVFSIIGLFTPDIIKWNKLSNIKYCINNNCLTISKKSNLIIEKILFTEILNIYSINENSKYESIIITYKKHNNKEIKKIKLYNIDKIDQVTELINKSILENQKAL